MSQAHRDEAVIRGHATPGMQAIAEARDALLAELDETRPHAAADNQRIVEAIDNLIMARLAWFAKTLHAAYVEERQP